MRQLLVIGVLAGMAGGHALGQALASDATAAAVGGTAGVVAGKKVREAVSPIFGKMANQLDKAAGDAAPKPKPTAPVAKPAAPAAKPAVAPVAGTPLIDIGPGVPKRVATTRAAAIQTSGGVPLPPPTPAKPNPAQTSPKPVYVEPILLSAPPPPPPPPVVTAEDLKQVTEGMDREDVLKLGAPASRITMFEDGHLNESYRYATKETSFGHVRLTDGKVSGVELR
jgi:hypothetical protein